MPTSQLVRETFPGIIRLWFGSLASIPIGFALCDGTQGTPDLRRRFPVGAGDTYAVDDIGGSTMHNHTFISDTHQHGLAPPAQMLPGSGIDGLSTFDTAVGTTDNEDGQPPFHSLAYIMEL